jgi:hypothetical protein
MSAYQKQVKDYVAQYVEEVGHKGGFDTHAFAAWAYEKRLLQPTRKTIIDSIAADVADVFRNEMRTDASGVKYRAMHAVKKKTAGNKTLWLWADMDHTTFNSKEEKHDHFVRSFADRRRQVVGDCLSAKNDVDVYNTKSGMPPIQFILDFTHDVEELQLLHKRLPDAA